MGEEELRQEESCEQNNCDKIKSIVGYDILAIIFCICPVLTSIFSIDYHNPNSVIQTSAKMILFALFPLAISLIGIKNADKAKSISSTAFSFVFVLMIIYLVIFLVGFADGGKLF